MAPVNEIAYEAIKDEKLKFAYRILDAMDEIVSFVGTRLNWEEPGEYLDYFSYIQVPST